MKGVKTIYNYFLDFGDDKEIVIPEGKADGTDNEKCQFYQWQYLKQNNINAFEKLWWLFTVLCKKIIIKEMKTKRFFLVDDEIGYKADIACEYVLRRYEKYKREKGQIYVMTNFVSCAYEGVMHALYDKSENDYLLSMCMEFNGKPIREIKRTASTNTEKIIEISETKRSVENKENENQSL